MPIPMYYSFDPETGEYAGCGLADLSPREIGVYLFPSNSTPVSPPVAPEGHAAVFLAGAWSLVADHRGETWWKDGEPTIVSAPGEPADLGFFPLPPVVGEGYVAELVDGEWVPVPDHRGETWFTQEGAAVIVDFTGDPSAAGLLEADPAPPSKNDVYAERERRLSIGFDYDFGDARGVHHIGTTRDDQLGWDEVTQAAAAMIATGNGSASIDLMTDSGSVTVTAVEWQSILLAAAQFRQPIWLASFALAMADPIPADFADDGNWPG